MKEKKIPLFLFGLLLIALSFVLGYLVGNGNGETVLQVSSQKPEAAVQEKQPVRQNLDHQAEPETDGLVNLNTADRLQLETLPGIGPELADRILSYREEYGPFVAIEQIMDVDGIGEIRFEKLESLITIGGTS